MKIKKDIKDLRIPYKKVIGTVINSTSISYFLFSKYDRDEKWYYSGEYDTKEECESHMAMHGEPESIEYIVIKGIQLDYEDGIAIYPFVIKEDEKEE
ncbi:MAG: hypothetical protein WC438_06005 [Candidatus Pacearchaeota archaeon]